MTTDIDSPGDQEFADDDSEDPTLSGSDAMPAMGEDDAAPVMGESDNGDSPVMGEIEPEAPVKVAKAEKPAKEKKAAPEKEAAPEDKPAEEALSEEQQKLPWYAVNTYAGYELRAKMSLEERVRSRGLSAHFGRVVVPQETVVEVVKGVKKTSTRKFFPGYMLIQLDLNDDTWHLVNETPKISGFVGDSRNPSPLTQQEVTSLLQQMEGGAQRPRLRVTFEEGDSVKVVDGPFVDFNGTVDEVKPDKGKLRVLISIFGRNTPVELDFTQVEKV